MLRRRKPHGSTGTESAGGGQREDTVIHSTALSHLSRTAQGLYGRQNYNPITSVATLPTYQLVNRLSAGGPPGKMPEAPPFPPLDTARFHFTAPVGQELETAQRILDATDFSRWLTIPDNASAEPAADATTGRSLGSMASHVGSALSAAASSAVQAFGLIARPTPSLADMVTTDPGALAAALLAPTLETRLTEQKTSIAAAGARYAALSVEIEMEKTLSCLQAAAGPVGDSLGPYVDRLKTLLRSLHEIPPNASDDIRQAQLQALRLHGAAMPGVPISVEVLLHRMLEQLDTVFAAQAQAQRAHGAARDRLSLVQDESMAFLARQAGAIDPALGHTLASLVDRLKARAFKEDQLPHDVVLKNVYGASVAAFAEPQPQAPLTLGALQAQLAARALQTLGTLDVMRLADATASADTQPSDLTAAVRLAREVAVLPRGSEMLSVLLAPQDPGAAKPSKETAARRDSALRVLFEAAAGLQASPPGNAERTIPANALAAAAQVLQKPDFTLDGLTPTHRHAFNAVRNGFLTNQGDSPLHQADGYLKGLTEEMLTSASRATGVTGFIARAVPTGGATALNPSAIASAVKTLRQAGLITDTNLAVDAMKEATASLRGNAATLPAEKALTHFGLSLGAAVSPAAPEQLLNLAAAQMRTPWGFGLDEKTLQAHPQLQMLWTAHESGSLKPIETARQLAVNARDELTRAKELDAAKGVTTFKKALDAAVGAAIWNRGKIDDKQELLDGLISIGRLMSLRDRFKFTGGNSFGLDTSKIQIGLGLPGPDVTPTLVARAGLAGKYQHDLVMEIGMTTQAYYLTVGTQSTLGAKVGGGMGVSMRISDNGAVGFGARLADVTASGSYESQWQNGLLARVPRDKATEATNQREFEDLLRHAVMWQEKGYAGPTEAILSNVDAASLNLLGQYDRRSARGDIAGSFGPQMRLSRPVSSTPAADDAAVPRAPGPSAKATSHEMFGQVRASLMQLRNQGELRHTKAEEASGHYRYQETRMGARSLTQRGASVTMSVRLNDFNQHTGLRGGDVAALGRTADWLGGAEVTKRLVTMDGVTAPLRSRRVSEFLDLSRFEAAARSDQARWIHHGNTYTKFPPAFKPAATQDKPEDFRLRHQSSEADFKQLFVDALALDNQFKQYLIVDCMQMSAAAVVDGYDASHLLAKKLGRPEEAAAALAEREAFLADESTWQPRRLVINNVFNTANQPGVSILGLDLRVSDNSEGAHNDVLFPRG